jgi:murein DD-endopeptidase MepM/ murein hydrolase activator NlpD
MTLARLALLATAGISAVLPQKPADPQAATYAATQTEGRALTAAFLEGKGLEALFAHLSPALKARIQTFEGFQAFQQNVVRGLGATPDLVSESVEAAGTATLYRRVVKGGAPVPFEIVWGLEPDGTVSTFAVRPQQGRRPEAAPSKHLDHANRSVFRLPFEGEWTVVWGGRTVEQNYHAANATQRFAMDLLVTKEGRSHAGDGRSLSDDYAWGQQILSPAEGTVVSAVDGAEDLKPGERMPPGSGNPAGNHVVIDHGSGEFSLLAHLRKGSVKVKAGDKVKAGQVLGLCGNSGNSSEPHLHIHLQDRAGFPGAAEGLPLAFTDFLADGAPVAKGELVKGMTVRPK